MSNYLNKLMNIAYLSLGSNEGNRQSWMEQAIDSLSVHAGNVFARSAFYETKAWGLTDQPDFLNMCIALETMLSPVDLLTVIQNTELQLGRTRTIKWGPRTLDVDILFFNNEIIQSEALIVPHPFVQDRRFVLMPLAEIASGLVHPIMKKTVAQLLDECPDGLEVKRIS